MLNKCANPNYDGQTYSHSCSHRKKKKSQGLNVAFVKLKTHKSSLNIKMFIKYCLIYC